jgi:hypothetical protein
MACTTSASAKKCEGDETMSEGCAECSREGRVSRAQTIPNLRKTLFFASEFEAFSLFVIVSIKDEVGGGGEETTDKETGRDVFPDGTISLSTSLVSPI